MTTIMYDGCEEKQNCSTVYIIMSHLGEMKQEMENKKYTNNKRTKFKVSFPRMQHPFTSKLDWITWH